MMFVDGLWFVVSILPLFAFWCYLYTPCVFYVPFLSAFNIIAWFTLKKKIIEIYLMKILILKIKNRQK